MLVYSLRIRLSIPGLVAGGSVWQGESELCTTERFMGRVPCIREVTGYLNQWLVEPSGNGGLCHNLLSGCEALCRAEFREVRGFLLEWLENPCDDQDLCYNLLKEVQN